MLLAKEGLHLLLFSAQEEINPKRIKEKIVKKRLGTDSNVTFVSCTYSLQELKELNAKLKVSFAVSFCISIGSISNWSKIILSELQISFLNLEIFLLEAKDEKVGSPS